MDAYGAAHAPVAGQLLGVGNALLCPRCDGLGEDQVDALVLFAFSQGWCCFAPGGCLHGQGLGGLCPPALLGCGPGRGGLSLWWPQTTVLCRKRERKDR